MKILIHDYAGHPFPVGLSRELAKRGHDVIHAFASGLLTPRGVLQRRPDDPGGLSFRPVPMSADYRKFKYSFLKRRKIERAYGRELERLLEAVAPDVVLSGQTPTEPQWAMVARALRLGVPVVSWVQDFYSIAVERLARRKSPVLGWLAGRWYRRLDRRCLRASRAVVAITGDFRPILRSFGVEEARIRVIPNWAPLEETPVWPRDNAWAQRHQLAGQFVFLYAGTLAMKHNPELLARLAGHFRADTEVRVVVISEGPGRDYLDEQKRLRGLDNLVLLPFLPFADVPAALGAAEVLLTVLEEDAGVFSVPSKVLTYHCAQRPLLAAMPPENLAARIMIETGSGLVVGPRAAAEFVDAAARLRHAPGLRESMGRQARSYAEEHFRCEAVADRFEALLCEAAAGDGGDGRPGRGPR